jgi:AcrR family transcriptional regulator
MGIRERRIRDRERRRQQILVAAKRVFSGRGYHKATMEEIAREAELSPGTIYLYFKNKDELYASLTLRVLQFLLIRLEQIQNDESLAEEQCLTALQQAFNDVYEFDPASLKNMFCLQSSEIRENLSEALLGEINAFTRKVLELVAQLFRRKFSISDSSDLQPDTLSIIVWSLFSGITLWEEFQKSVYGKEDTRAQTLERAFCIFDRGVKHAVCLEPSS